MILLIYYVKERVQKSQKCHDLLESTYSKCLSHQLGVRLETKSKER